MCGGDGKFKCNRTMEMAVLFDVTRSIPPQSFQAVRSAVAEFVQDFEIGPSQTRVALVPYDAEVRDAQPGEAFALDRYPDAAAVATHISQLKQLSLHYEDADTTETWKALEYARTRTLSTRVTRPKVPRVAVVLTDGESRRGDMTAAEARAKTVEEAARLRASGVRVWAVAYGDPANHGDGGELRGIAGDDDHVIMAEAIGTLVEKLHQVAKLVCKEVEKSKDDPDSTTTTPEPTTPPIVCSQTPVELMFVVDTSASIAREGGPTAFDKGKEFLAALVGELDIGPGPRQSRVATVQFAKGVREEAAIPFDMYLDKESLTTALKDLKYFFDRYFGSKTRIGEGIDYATASFLPAARAGVPRVMVVVTDGRSNYDTNVSYSKSAERTAEAAQRAKDAGVTLFSVGIGSARREELEAIASAGRRKWFQVTDYGALMGIKEQITQEICQTSHETLLAAALNP